MAIGYQIERSRAALQDARVVDIDLSPDEGEIVAHIDLAALTSNNVTYAAFGGPPMHYWNFFPASDSAWGIVPVWGFATISESRHPDIAVGARFFGYWPSATHLKLRPGPLKAGGFADMAAHRQGLAAVYNNYRPAGGASAQADRLMALYQPLYGTGHVLARVLLPAAEAGQHVILTSATSKTALATAWNLAQAGHPAIGLTSARNKELAEITGYYRTVLSYDELAELDAGAESTLVDFSGNAEVLKFLHRHLKALKASHLVGYTNVGSPPPDHLEGPTPEFFFAPTHWEAQARAKGPAQFETELAEGRDAFAASTLPWLKLEHLTGADAYLEAFTLLLAGKVNPREGMIWQP